jgi:ferredoxin
MTEGELGSVDPDGSGDDTVRVVVIGPDDSGDVSEGRDRTVLAVERGRTLRDVLLEADRSPYAAATERLNCGGRGLCATCGVRIREGPAPTHWHDRLADRFGYPRLSCRVVVDRPMTVELVDKRVWGGRERPP